MQLQLDHTEQAESGHPLRTGKCGAYDLSGLRVGTLTVTATSKSKIGKGSGRQRVHWLCNCDCGRSKWIMSQLLVGAKPTLSCGCKRLAGSRAFRESLIGKQFGKMTVIKDHSPDPTHRGGRLLCRCECGAEKVVVTDLFKQDAVSSCGCNSGILPPGHATRNIVLNRYKKQARIRNKEWALTDEEALFLLGCDCHYCGSGPGNTQGNGSAGRWNGEYTYSGIDRKDNDQGYLPDNVVPCCATCNRAKNVQPYGQFMTWIENLIKYRAVTTPNVTADAV
jgi:hypothetical protein